MTSSSEAGPPGWYGKLAMLGDFAQRRLPDELVQRLDGWLAGWIASSRRELGARWLPAYLAAPVLRFAWAPGVVDRRWWFGVLMPSCDSAGRYFPLVVGQPATHPPRDRAGLTRLGRWYDQVADVATATLDDRATVAAFEAALAATPRWGPERSAGDIGRDLAFDADLPTEALAPAGIEIGPEIVALLAPAGDDELAGCSIWWSDATATRPAGPVSILRALPEPAAITGLLLGIDRTTETDPA